MLVLALDTTTAQGSGAVARDGDSILERVIASPAGHAESLPAALIALLDEARITLRDVDVFAVATGPGSFTGLRIGIATMQGLAFAEGKPLIGVSGFDALAAISGARGRVATWVDAWRGEVFAALYEDGQEIEAPTVSKPDGILDRVLDASGGRTLLRPTLFIGDGAAAHREVIVRIMGDHGRVADPVAPVLAGAIARLGATAAAAGDTAPPHAIRPLYVRRSDAEIVRDARTVR